MFPRVAKSLGLALLLFVSPGCEFNTSNVQNCDVVAHSGSNAYQIDYQLTIPSNCPVPIGVAGELKRAGARIFDEGTRDFNYAEVAVYNSDRTFVASRLFRFISDDQGRYGAVPRTEYEAATGSHGGNNLDNKFDYGYFSVTNNSNGSVPGDPFGEVEITHRFSGMLASVGGTTAPARNTSVTWNANVTGGTSPYTYNWFRDGTHVGTGPTYTTSVGTEDFNLLAEVTDAAMVVRKAVVPVDVDGVRVSLSGPTAVQYAENGGTWTASVQGGFAPYSIDWYLDGELVGSDETWGGYPGEGPHELSVRVSDNSGSSHSATMTISGFGNDTCQPVPPALRCTS